MKECAHTQMITIIPVSMVCRLFLSDGLQADKNVSLLDDKVGNTLVMKEDLTQIVVF
jgi:hypothetical protein